MRTACWHARPPHAPPVPSLTAPAVARRSPPDFFQDGRLITMASLSARVDVFDDAEYLGGVIQLAQELGNYAVGQAISKDTASIQLCRDLVEALSGVLISFDFRNGPLRRKYDSVKYAIKRLEDLLYEQSLLADAPPAKRARIEKADGGASTVAAGGADAEGGEAKAEAEPAGMVDAAEFDAIRQRMEDFDAAREKVCTKSPPHRTTATGQAPSRHGVTAPPCSAATQPRTRSNDTSQSLRATLPGDQGHARPSETGQAGHIRRAPRQHGQRRGEVGRRHGEDQASVANHRRAPCAATW